MSNKKLDMKFTGSRFIPDDTAKGLFMFLVLQTMVSLVYQVLYMMGFVQDVWSYIFTFILQLSFVACVYFVAKPRKINLVANLRMKKAPTFKQVLLSIAISIVCLFGFSALTNLFLEILFKFGYTQVTSDVVIPNFGTYIFYVIVICVTPAICEEILFRGLICNGLKKRGTATAIIGSAFIFMIMHGSPDQTVHQFILGIILAIAFLVTNNLWVPIIIHFVNNFTAVTISYIVYGDSAESTTGAVETYLIEYALYAILSAVVAGLLIYLLFRLLSKAGRKSEVEPVEKKETAPVAGVLDDFVINYERAGEISAEIDVVQGQVAEPVIIPPAENRYERKFSGGGRAMYIISIVWLIIDWVSALLLGFGQIG